MPLFAYKAKEANGNITTGTVEAVKEGEAVAKLRSQKLTVVEIAESTPSVFSKIKEKIPGFGTPDRKSVV